MRYTIEAKPTYYKGIHFRSKLEAQWAAFFDLSGIKYEYEPENFGAWQPDFLIHGVKPIYVEVKPFINDDIIKEYRLKCDQIIKSGDVSKTTVNDSLLGEYVYYEVESNYKVILISNPRGHEKDELNEGYMEIPFGVLYEFYGHCVGHSSLYWKDNFDFASQLNFWDGLIGTSENRKYFMDSNLPEFNDLYQMWDNAKNIIQTQIH